ncbi:hypothetical protein PoB_004671400 [Plakobranchus ocellatus]|uniref:Uncharacterized protein n=1 Tax=Plakobranchus ocellatus TaxID=259542 RepID=A0AAV4BJB2_9GAST|nr:hypothetical protein PoB_004671400 [Plakobranchus ocellatus]
MKRTVLLTAVSIVLVLLPEMEAVRVGAVFPASTKNAPGSAGTKEVKYKHHFNPHLNRNMLKLCRFLRHKVDDEVSQH